MKCERKNMRQVITEVIKERKAAEMIMEKKAAEMTEVGEPDGEEKFERKEVRQRITEVIEEGKAAEIMAEEAELKLENGACKLIKYLGGLHNCVTDQFEQFDHATDQVEQFEQFNHATDQANHIGEPERELLFEVLLQENQGKIRRMNIFLEVLLDLAMVILIMAMAQLWLFNSSPLPGAKS